MSELKNCPFCGGEPDIKRGKVKLHGDILGNSAVVCYNFNCVGIAPDLFYCTDEDAIKAWNKRPRETALSTTIKEQAELIEELTKVSFDLHENSKALAMALVMSSMTDCEEGAFDEYLEDFEKSSKEIVPLLKKAKQTKENDYAT